MRLVHRAAFAPTDAAFKKLGDDTIKALLEDKAKLAKVLKYHVIAGAVPAGEALKLNGKSVKTVAGPEIKFEVKGTGSDKTLVLNGTAKVIAVDGKAKNGVIHVIDTVLMPPE